MSHIKKDEDDESLVGHDAFNDDVSMQDVANLALETLVESYKTDGEPFEVYAQKLKSHIHTDPEVFRHRFTQGYEMMMDILRKPEKKEL